MDSLDTTINEMVYPLKKIVCIYREKRNIKTNFEIILFISKIGIITSLLDPLTQLYLSSHKRKGTPILNLKYFHNHLNVFLWLDTA